MKHMKLPASEEFLSLGEDEKGEKGISLLFLEEEEERCAVARNCMAGKEIDHQNRAKSWKGEKGISL